MDIYAEAKESAVVTTSNAAQTLDELWAGLNDNQAFQSMHSLQSHTPIMMSYTPSLSRALQTSSSSFCS
jgi:hypothetical protein